jgi:histidinol dehydrogenase
MDEETRMPCRRLRYTGPADLDVIGTWLETRYTLDTGALDSAREILAEVRARGDAALVEYTRRFDCPGFQEQLLRVPSGDIEAARRDVGGQDMEIIAEAADNIRAFHRRQKGNSWWMQTREGATLGQRVQPVDSAGLYIPGGAGGETPLISTLLMTAIPAQVAGVRNIRLVSPPRKDGSLNPYILAAAGLLGLHEVFRAGSAWAVAALAFGTETIPAVDVIAGPGNIFVTAAKQLVAGQVGIDMLAGPSEIAILADASADPAWIAADMLSQAEHDPMSASVCVTCDSSLGDAVLRHLKEQLTGLPRSEIAAKALADYGAVIDVADPDLGTQLVNSLAPEHLELALADPWPWLAKIRNAGAVFLGSHSPEPLGDYFAGPNHVLPTMRTARFSQALSVDTFVKKTSVVAATSAYLDAHGDKVARLARLEGLEAHARSVDIRKTRNAKD